ncbi:MAG TPA: nitronate monooxygenase, partial [bacterium]
MTVQTSLMRKLGMTTPIIQAPMAGGGDTPALVAAVCEAGGFGSIGATYLTPEKALDAAKQVRAKTQRPFGINLFAPMSKPVTEGPVAKAVERIAPYYAELGLPAPQPPAYTGDTFDQLLPAVLESGAAVFSFTFGLVPPEAFQRIRARGMLIAGTATTVAEAQALEQA